MVFHAAAYKHVPLVEDNFMQSMINNIFSTKAVCEASLFNKVELMMLISQIRQSGQQILWEYLRGFLN